MRKKVKLPFAFPKKSTVEQKDTAVESVPAEIGKEVNFVENISGKIFSISQEVLTRIEKACGD